MTSANTTVRKSCALFRSSKFEHERYVVWILGPVNVALQQQSLAGSNLGVNRREKFCGIEYEAKA